MRPVRFLAFASLSTVAAVLAASLVHAQTAPDQLPPAAPPGPETSPSGSALAPPPEPVPPSEVAPAPEPTDVPDETAGEAKPAPAPDQGEPGKRQRHASAVIQALDKITAETMRFEAKVGKPVRYKGLVFTVRSCETTASDEPMKDSVAYMEVRAEPKAQTEERPSRQVFKGWMFASSPGLHPLEHPVYDAWLIACKA
jgi:hypothetical protein